MISHQAVSKAIKNLEDELSIKILARSTKGVSYTKAGEQLYQFAEIVLKEKALFEQNIAAYKMHSEPEIIGDLTIYAVPRYITPPFLSFVDNIKSRYPHLNITIHNDNAAHIIENVTFDDTTIAFLTIGFNQTEPLTEQPDELFDFVKRNHLTYEVLDKQLLYGRVHQKSKLTSYDVLTNAIFESYPYVSFTYPFYKDYNKQFTIDGFEQQKDLIKKGNCFGRYTKQEFQNFFSKQYRLIPLADMPTLQFIAVYDRNVKGTIIPLFLEQMKHMVKF